MKRLPNAFADVASVLDAAIAAGGGTYTLPTPGKATHWRQRAYTLRKILGEINLKRKGEDPGAVATTPYDTLYLRILPSAPCDVVIEFNEARGVFKAPDGKVVDLAAPTPVIKQDDLELEAAELRRSLGLDD